MTKFIKYFYILIFFITAVVVAIFISKNSGTWKTVYELQKNENDQVRKAALEQASKIDGILLTIDSGGGLHETPCTHNSQEALGLLTSELEKENNSPGYFNSEVKPLLSETKIENDDYFYKLTLPPGLPSSKYIGVVNIFDCNFFEPKFTYRISPDSMPLDINLGVLNRDKNETELNKLAEVLYNFYIIDLDGFGQSIEIKDKTTTDSEDLITRKDSGIFSVSDDVWPGNVKKSVVNIIFTLNKDTGEVLLSKNEE